MQTRRVEQGFECDLVMPDRSLVLPCDMLEVITKEKFTEYYGFRVEVLGWTEALKTFRIRIVGQRHLDHPDVTPILARMVNRSAQRRAELDAYEPRSLGSSIYDFRFEMVLGIATGVVVLGFMFAHVLSRFW